jgi:hypothetical protein
MDQTDRSEHLSATNYLHPRTPHLLSLSPLFHCSSSLPLTMTRVRRSPRTRARTNRSKQAFYAAQAYHRRASYYQAIRARFGHPNDSTKCRYCGVLEHVALHHEDDFKRAGTNIPAPSILSPNRLAAEVKRCTRKDGSIGLVSLCFQCHCNAERKLRFSSRDDPWLRRFQLRNRRADVAAKMARGRCECDDGCGRLVTSENVTEFEWDHLVQSFNDREYRLVSALVGRTASLARCDMERRKCRLLYVTCHHRHSGVQRRQWAQRRAEQGFTIHLL